MKKIKWLAFILLIVSIIAIAFGLANIKPVSEVERPEMTKEDYLRDAVRAFDRGSYMQSILSYESALELDENDVDILRRIAECYSKLSNVEKETELRKKITELEPSDAENWYAYIQISLRDKKLDEAKQLTENALKVTNSDDLKELYAQMDIAKPVVSVEAGTYDDYQLVTIGGSENCIYYYTVDGNEPNEASRKYTDDGIVISNPETTLKVIAVGFLGYVSPVTEVSYTITKPVEKVGDRYDDFIYRIKYDFFGKGWDEDLYNYEMAQIREMHILGEYYVWGSDESREISFEENGYKMYSSYYYDKGYRNDLSTLKYMPYLKKLTVGYQRDFSVSYISSLTYLEELSILNCSVTDISDIKNLTNLRTLALGWNDIADISAISGLSQLTSLGLWNNNISNVGSLSGLSKLTYFDISNNHVSDISCINGMPELKDLWVNGNSISDFSPLDGCSNLTTIMVMGNNSKNYGTWQERKNELIKTDME